MVFFDLYQNRWLFFVFLGGASLVIIFALTYRAMWRPREEEREKGSPPITGPRSFLRWLLATVPWVLILTILGTLAYTAWHVAARAINPPNW
jgi:heme/copper-type cytochrome/quinol oxidase subunit 2